MKGILKTKEEIRASFAKRLGTADIEDDDWNDSLVQDEVAEYLFRFDIEYLDTALKYLRKVINLRGQRPSTSRSKPNREELPRTILSDHEEARAQAQAADLAHLASTEPSVLDFRRNILGFIPRGQADGACGRLLNDVEAAAFVSSPIARSLERWEYERLGLSYIGPNAAVGEEHFERDESFSIRYRVTIGEKIIRSWVVSAHDPPPYSIWHETIIEEGVTWAEHQVHQGSIIDMLRKVGDRLAHRYGWAQAPALRFILTGHTPTIDPIRGETSRLRTGVGEPLLEEITLVVKPWLSEEAVVKMYREGQRRLLASENVRQRWKSPRNYRVFQFVIEHTDSDGQHQSAQKLMELWNEQHESVPEDQYHDRRNFWRDYKSGQVTLWM